MNANKSDNRGLNDFINPSNPPKIGPIKPVKALPAPKVTDGDNAPSNSPDGLTTAFGLLFAGSKPYNAQEQAEKTFTVSYFDREDKTYRAGDYAKYYRHQSFREDGRAAGDLAGMVERIELVRTWADKYIARVPDNAESIKHAYNHFAKRHTEFSLAYIANNGNMASAMITGPSNFPVARQRKLSDRHHKKWEKLRDHIEIGQKSIKRAAFPYGDPKDAIRSNNPDAIRLLKDKIALSEKKQAIYKKTNADLRKALRQDDPQAFMVSLGYSEGEARVYLKPPAYGPHKAFQAYVLTNNNANIKRLKKRLAELERVKEVESITNHVELESGERIELVRNTDAMRIQLIFDGKPSEAIRKVLKSNGFRWSPKATAWQRHLNSNSWYATKRALKALGATTIPVMDGEA